MNYGSDFYLDEDGDIVFAADGDIKTENTSRLIAQDLKEEASIPLGSVPWDEEAGSLFFEMLNNEGFQDDDVLSELERLALKDPRIDASYVLAQKGNRGQFQLSYRPLGTISDKILLFDLNSLFSGDDNE